MKTMARIKVGLSFVGIVQP